MPNMDFRMKLYIEVDAQSDSKVEVDIAGNSTSISNSVSNSIAMSCQKSDGFDVSTFVFRV